VTAGWGRVTAGLGASLTARGTMAAKLRAAEVDAGVEVNAGVNSGQELGGGKSVTNRH
jgi:hypothetical protein